MSDFLAINVSVIGSNSSSCSSSFSGKSHNEKIEKQKMEYIPQ